MNEQNQLLLHQQSQNRKTAGGCRLLLYLLYLNTNKNRPIGAVFLIHCLQDMLAFIQAG